MDFLQSRQSLNFFGFNYSTPLVSATIGTGMVRKGSFTALAADRQIRCRIFFVGASFIPF
jgi:hypothetical protein